MNKILKYEIMIMAALLVVALVVRFCTAPLEVPSPSDPIDSPSDTAQSTQQTTAEPSNPETTVQPLPPLQDIAITWKTFPADRQLTARKAFVYDCESESFTYLRGMELDRVYPASITKLFALYVALQHLDPTQTITAGDVLDLVGEGSSVAEIEKGNVLTVDMLVEATLLPSGCDATYILAAEVGWQLSGDPSLSPSQAVAVFVEEMNRQAKANGMHSTHFVSPDGYHDDDHYTALGDLVTIAKLVMQTDIIMKYAHVKSATETFESGESKFWENTNLLLDPETEYYCPYAVGLKTGRTSAAGSCLLSVFNIEGRSIIIGVFDCPLREDRFDDALQLLNQYLENG